MSNILKLQFGEVTRIVKIEKSLQKLQEVVQEMMSVQNRFLLCYTKNYQTIVIRDQENYEEFLNSKENILKVILLQNELIKIQISYGTKLFTFNDCKDFSTLIAHAQELVTDINQYQIFACFGKEEILTTNNEIFQQILKDQVDTLKFILKKKAQMVTVQVKNDTSQSFIYTLPDSFEELIQTFKNSWENFSLTFMCENEITALGSEIEFEYFKDQGAQIILLEVLPSTNSNIMNTQPQSQINYYNQQEEVRVDQNTNNLTKENTDSQTQDNNKQNAKTLEESKTQSIKQIAEPRGDSRNKQAEEFSTIFRIQRKFVKDSEVGTLKNQKQINVEDEELTIKRILQDTQDLAINWEKTSIIGLFRDVLKQKMMTFQGIKNVQTILEKTFRTLKKHRLNDPFLNNSPYSQLTYFTAMLIAHDDMGKAQLNSLLLKYYPTPLYYPLYTKVGLKIVLNEQILWSLKSSYVCISIPIGEKAKGKIGKTTLLIDLFKLPIQKTPDFHTYDPFSRRIVTLFQNQNISQTSDQIDDRELDKVASWSFIDVPGLVSYRDIPEILKLTSILFAQMHIDDVNDLIEFTEHLKLQNIRRYMLVVYLHGYDHRQIFYQPQLNLVNEEFNLIKFVPISRSLNGNIEIEEIRQSFMEDFWEYTRKVSFKYDFTKQSFSQIVDPKISNKLDKINHFMLQLQKIKDQGKLFHQYFTFYPINVTKNIINEVKAILIHQRGEKTSAEMQYISDSIERLRLYENKQDELLQKAKISQIMFEFLEIFADPYRSTLLGELSEQLKEFSFNQSEEQKQLKHAHDRLSVELFMRELFLIMEYAESQPNLKDTFKKAFKHYVLSGEPFELIDGDNNQSLFKFFKQFLIDFKVQECFYLSILGPQSSGKSTVLKFAFGSNFQTSAGRCTRGVYASLQRFILKDQTKHILLIDTEGIESAERKTIQQFEYYQRLLENNGIQDIALQKDFFNKGLNFDSIMTMYLFQISDCVLINVKSENIGSHMNDLLILSFRGIAILKQNSLPPPELAIVLNQQGNRSQKIIKDQIKSVFSQLQDNNQVQQLLKHQFQSGQNKKFLEVKETNLFILQNAFKTQEAIYSSEFPGLIEEFNYQMPEELFGSQAIKLKNSVIPLIEQRNDTSKDSRTLIQWLQMSEHIWEQCLRQRELLVLRNLQELREKEIYHQFQGQVQIKFQMNLFDSEQQKIIQEFILQFQKTLVQDRDQAKTQEEEVLQKISENYQLKFQEIREALFELKREQNLRIEYLESEIMNAISNSLQRECLSYKNSIKTQADSFRAKSSIVLCENLIEQKLFTILQSGKLDYINPQKEFDTVFYDIMDTEMKRQKEIQTTILKELSQIEDLVHSLAPDEVNKLELQKLKQDLNITSINDIIQWVKNKLIYEIQNKTDVQKVLQALDNEFIHSDLAKQLQTDPYNESGFKYFNLKDCVSLTQKSKSNFFDQFKKQNQEYGFTLNPRCNNCSPYSIMFFQLLLIKEKERMRLLNQQGFDKWLSILNFVKEFCNFDKLIKKIQQIAEQVDNVDSNNLQNRIQDIKEEIALYNYEIRQVHLALQKKTEQSLFVIPILVWAKISFEIQQQKQKKFIRIVDQIKAEQYHKFIQKIENLRDFEMKSRSGEIDRNSARTFCNELENQLVELCTQEAIQQYCSQDPKLSLKSTYNQLLIKTYLNQIQDFSQNIEQIYNYTMDPVGSIEIQIKSEYQTLAAGPEKEAIEFCKQMYAVEMEKLRYFFANLTVHLKEKQKKYTPHSLKLPSELSKNKAMIQYVFKELIKAILQFSTQNSNEIVIDKNTINISQAFLDGIPNIYQDNFQAKFKKVIIQKLQNTEIYDLIEFSSALQKNIKESNCPTNKLMLQLLQIQKDSINSIIVNCKLCGIRCPSCGRACDHEINHPSTKRHKCSFGIKYRQLLGHFFMAFRGWEDYNTKQAVLFSCDINHRDQGAKYSYKGDMIPWENWITFHQEWDFTVNDLESMANFEKMKKIWTLRDGYIGKKICEKQKIVYHEQFPQFTQ